MLINHQNIQILGENYKILVILPKNVRWSYTKWYNSSCQIHSRNDPDLNIFLLTGFSKKMLRFQMLA